MGGEGGGISPAFREQRGSVMVERRCVKNLITVFIDRFLQAVKIQIRQCVAINAFQDATIISHHHRGDGDRSCDHFRYMALFCTQMYYFFGTVYDTVSKCFASCLENDESARGRCERTNSKKAVVRGSWGILKHSVQLTHRSNNVGERSRVNCVLNISGQMYTDDTER